MSKSEGSSVVTCPFCPTRIKADEVLADNYLCLFLTLDHPVLSGSGIIVPRAHRETIFDLQSEEVAATFSLLAEVKKMLDEQYGPAGYNVGWNNGAVAGQSVFHAHMHVIPRFADEPFAGRGIRYWLKQEDNRRGP